MKIIRIFFFAIFFIKNSVLAQNIEDLNQIFILTQLNNFIDTAKVNSIGTGKFNVYVIHIYEGDDKNLFCFTLGYIMNSSSYKYIKPDYFLIYKDEFVLIRVKDKLKFNLDEIRNFFPNAEKINGKLSVPIVQKLFPIELGGITGITRGMILCSMEDKFEKIFFNNSDDIPLSKSIYAEFPAGGSFDLIKD